jgi:hypothetical protein
MVPFQGANLSVRSGAITPGNELTAPDKHKKLMWSGTKNSASLIHSPIIPLTYLRSFLVSAFHLEALKY